MRELQNIVEHAVITSKGDRLFPEIALDQPRAAAESTADDILPPIMTAAELRDLQRDNMTRALKACGGRISGDKGAAQLLGMKASTMRSQMKALGIAEQGY